MVGRDPEKVTPTERIGDISVDLRGRPSDKLRTGGWKAAHFAFGMLVMETMATLGLVINLVTYFFFIEHFSVADAANGSTNWLGINFLLTVLGGFVSDAYLGRYWTTIYSSFILIAGYVVLIATAAALRPPECVPTLTTICKPARVKYLAPLYTGLYLIAVGSAGVKPNVNALGADQFDDNDPRERSEGRTYFNMSFLYSQIGAIVGFTFMVYMQDHVSFQSAYGTMMGLFVVAFAVFIAGTPFFRHKVPSGSPLTRVAQVVVGAGRKWSVPVPADPAQLLEVADGDASAIKGTRKLAHTNKFRFLDKAAVLQQGDSAEKDGPWRVVTVTQVEELKRVLLMLPIWLCSAIVYLIFAQFVAFTVQQGSTMNRHFGPHFVMPPASLGFFSFMAAALLIPLYVILLPYVRKFTGHRLGISPLNRIGVGIIFAFFTMIVAALVERKRLSYVRSLGLENAIIGTFVIDDMRIYWIVPQYLLLALTELFVYVGQMEFFYGESPDSLRSLAVSLTHTAQALGYLLSSALVNSVNHYTRHTSYGAWLVEKLNSGGLQRFFWLLAVVALVDFAFFLVFCYFYEYKQLNVRHMATDDLSQVEPELDAHEQQKTAAVDYEDFSLIESDEDYRKRMAKSSQ